MKLKDQIAIITGAGSGIGKAAAQLFAQEGATVVVADISEARGSNACKEIIESGGIADFIRVNVMEPDEVKEMVNVVIQKYKRIDILFNNAGMPQPFQKAEEIDDNFIDQIIGVNIKGAFLCTKYTIPTMKYHKKGVILYTSSMTGIRPMPGTNLYAITKGAINTMTKAFAVELAQYNIRVNAIAPVAVDTPMLNDFISEENKRAGKEKLVSQFPMGRLVTPEEVAKAALYLASNDAEMITGSILQLDGGRGL